MEDKYRELIEHKKRFDEIILKYKLNEGEKAQEIAKFLTNPNESQKISSEEFATLFNMHKNDAVIFLSFIQRGIEFKKEIDKNK